MFYRSFSLAVDKAENPFRQFPELKKFITWLPARTGVGLYFRVSSQYFCDYRYQLNKINEQVIFDSQALCPLHLAKISKQNLRPANPPLTSMVPQKRHWQWTRRQEYTFCQGRFIQYISHTYLSLHIQYDQETLLLISLVNFPISKKKPGNFFFNARQNMQCMQWFCILFQTSVDCKGEQAAKPLLAQFMTITCSKMTGKMQYMKTN